MKKVKNFGRYWALIKNIPGDHNGLKESHVKTFTRGRTASLHEMSPDEYNRMCDALQAALSPGMTQQEHTAAIKKARSAVLKRMGKLGIDTNDWAEVDNFCLSPRIAGKVFRALSLDELRGLIPKLEAIARKPRPAPVPDPMVDPAFLNQMTQLTKNQIPN